MASEQNNTLVKSPKVSVIIPCFNHERFIEQAITSVFEQTYKNVELIVIDDGSEDNSRSLIELLRKRYNFSYFTQPNSGISVTLNKCIRHSTGEYICLLASDDFYAPEKISTQVAFYEQNPSLGFIHSGCISVDENGQELTRTDFAKVSWDIKRPFDLLLEACFVSGPSVMIKRSVLDDVGLFDEQLAIEDWDMWLRIAKKYEIGFQKKWLVYSRKHGDNTYYTENPIKILKMYRAEKVILSKWRLEPAFQKVMVERYLKWFYMLSGVSRRAAFPYLFRTIPFFYHHFYYKALTKFLLGNRLFMKLRSNKYF